MVLNTRSVGSGAQMAMAEEIIWSEEVETRTINKSYEKIERKAERRCSSLTEVFLNLSTIDFWAGWLFAGESSCAVYCVEFRSTPGLHLLDARSNASPSSCVSQNASQCSWMSAGGAMFCPFERYCCREMFDLKIWDLVLTRSRVCSWELGGWANRENIIESEKFEELRPSSDQKIKIIFKKSSSLFKDCCCCCCFSRVRLCATPQTAAQQAPPSLGFSRQEHWRGLPFPSPMHESEKWKWSRSVLSNS